MPFSSIISESLHTFSQINPTIFSCQCNKITVRRFLKFLHSEKYSYDLFCLDASLSLNHHPRDQSRIFLSIDMKMLQDLRYVKKASVYNSLTFFPILSIYIVTLTSQCFVFLKNCGVALSKKRKTKN